MNTNSIEQTSDGCTYFYNLETGYYLFHSDLNQTGSRNSIQPITDSVLFIQILKCLKAFEGDTALLKKILFWKWHSYLNFMFNTLWRNGTLNALISDLKMYKYIDKSWLWKNVFLYICIL